MSGIEELQSHKCFGGWQKVFAHDSKSTACDMEFAVFVPPATEHQKCPVLYWLSGLTCTWENFVAKAGAQRAASEYGIILVAPDTSPRGVDIQGQDESYDFGSGAGFYLDATENPWSKHYHMYSYVTQELPEIIEHHFPIDPDKQGIFGHSMGGHGALVAALKNPDFYKSVSAFAPIVNPADVPWGQKAFSGYLGQDSQKWNTYDASSLTAQSGWDRPILIDQGTDDNFLYEQLQPEVFEKACAIAGIDLTLNMREGYDHSYYFIASFIEGHIKWHTRNLQATL